MSLVSTMRPAYLLRVTQSSGAPPYIVSSTTKATVVLGVLSMLLVPSLASDLLAQTRQLSWPRIAVTAHLDSTGTLHIRERQTLRLSGDWNGAEREFNLRNGHTLALRRLSRIPPAGPPVELRHDENVDDVDEFTWSGNGNTLRWRARRPGDPPFDDDTLVYELEFETGRILVPTGDGGYQLDHNFTLVDRAGDIDRFELTLTLDSTWRAPTDFTGRWVAGPLRPGEGWRVTIPLSYQRAGLPAGIRLGAGGTARRAILAALFLALLVLLARLIRREAQLGRFRPILDQSAVTREFLDHHVFRQLPEAVGTAWDDHTAAPEVAAILARLVQEGKLSSRVESEKVLWFTHEELHLEREVELSAFRPHERSLIDGLFASGNRTTSTSQVRARYKKTGFDPANLIRAQVEKLLGSTVPEGTKPDWRPTALLLLAGLVLTGAGIARDRADAQAAVIALFISLPAFLGSSIFAYVWRRAVRASVVGTAVMLLPLAGIVTAFAALLLVAPVDRLGVITLVGLALWVLGLARSILNIAASRHSAERIELRQRLFTARRFFLEQLRLPQPALRDEWYPYVIAFGLGSAADKWFKAFGAARDPGVLAVGRSSGASSATGGSGWTGFGGGGGFSGAGSSASFAAAVGGMAASVPSPSSGGSGGSSSGGGSSGGGGGGGW